MNLQDNLHPLEQSQKLNRYMNKEICHLLGLGDTPISTDQCYQLNHQREIDPKKRNKFTSMLRRAFSAAISPIGFEFPKNPFLASA